ncbi:hypothetical protein Ptr902_11471 [Pyrenophora tritici-repentis]|nr:hypothetical protein L13192_11722 [Pyrenophora tritici-repentis]KAI2476929.1 hypothetical protein Ptr902_11471 [Pyrenophora tritici-repentis]PZC98939.1 hypothetical protein A1F95_03848 [Pyrenophora tritici-repentis]
MSTPIPTPPFLNLPLELRQQIYHNLLAPTLRTHRLLITLVQRPSTTTYTLHSLSHIASLLTTYRTLSTEILIYTFTHFTFHLLPPPNSTPASLCASSTEESGLATGRL